MRKLLLYFCLVIIVVLGVAIYNHSNHVTLPGDQSVTPTPAPWLPAQLSIPGLHIDAPVMGVGKDSSGAMEAPTSQSINSPYWTSVFWYDLGTAPGQPGNAVIAGHVDRVGGDPAVFWSLKNLTPGNKVSIRTLQGNWLHFVVDRSVTYPANASSQDVINAVFGPTTEHHLNLITCSGVWTSNGYDSRLVVFTTQV